MFLKKLSIRNVRSIENLELSFTNPDGSPRRWTLLLGENGAGKSTVLRAIALILSGSDALPEILVDADDWIRSGSNSGGIGLDLSTGHHLELKLRRGEGISQTLDANREALRDLDRLVRAHTGNFFTIGYGVSRRIQSSRAASFGSSELMRQIRSQRVATLFTPDATLSPVVAWAMDLDYRKPEDSQRILRNTFSEMVPGVEFERIDKESRRLLFQTPDGVLPLELLSDGYQNIISWCGDLLYRVTDTFSSSVSPLDAKGVLLIDEVDLHLHPLWQRRLIDFLQKKLPHFQIFATTHSPLTAHQCSDGELYLLRRLTTNAASQLAAFPGDPRKLLLHQFLLSPAFGLQTADSRYIEELKDEYDHLRQQPAKSSDDQRRQAELADQLADTPSWRIQTPETQKQVRLLEEIRRGLADLKR